MFKTAAVTDTLDFKACVTVAIWNIKISSSEFLSNFENEVTVFIFSMAENIENYEEEVGIFEIYAVCTPILLKGGGRNFKDLMLFE